MPVLRVCGSDLGCHIDGYIATVAHTVVVGEAEVTGPKADVMTAAYTGLQVAWKSCRAGAKVRHGHAPVCSLPCAMCDAILTPCVRPSVHARSTGL